MKNILDNNLLNKLFLEISNCEILFEKFPFNETKVIFILNDNRSLTFHINLNYKNNPNYYLTCFESFLLLDQITLKKEHLKNYENTLDLFLTCYNKIINLKDDEMSIKDKSIEHIKEMF